MLAFKIAPTFQLDFSMLTRAAHFLLDACRSCTSHQNFAFTLSWKDFPSYLSLPCYTQGWPLGAFPVLLGLVGSLLIQMCSCFSLSCGIPFPKIPSHLLISTSQSGLIPQWTPNSLQGAAGGRILHWDFACLFINVFKQSIKTSSRCVYL